MIFTTNEVRRLAIQLQADPDLNNSWTKRDLQITARYIDDEVSELHRQVRNEDQPEKEFVQTCIQYSKNTKDGLRKRAYLWLAFAAQKLCEKKIRELQAVVDL